MIRIDSMWLAVEPVDMRAGADRRKRLAIPALSSAMRCLSCCHNRVVGHTVPSGDPWRASLGTQIP